MKKIIIIAITLLLCVSAIGAKPEKKVQTVTFISSMDCKNCVKKITENVSFEKGVKDLSADLETHTVTITFDPAKTDTTTLAASIRKLGYTADLKK